MVDSLLPPKLDVANKLLEESSLFIHLDPRATGVVVPTWFKKQPQLVLQVGLAMAVPIPDLQVGAEGISCTLSFSRQMHWCFLPWTAVFALVGDDGRGMVWPEDVPPEVARQADLRGPPPKPTTRKRAPALAPIDSPEAPNERSPEPAAGPRLALVPSGHPPSERPAAVAAEPAAATPPPKPVQSPRDGRADAEATGASAHAPADDASPPPGPKRERPSWLRVVKGGAEG